MRRVTARAQVRVTVEFSLADSWANDCTLTQVQDQAAEAALRAIRTACGSSIAIIGRPEVRAIITTPEVESR